MSRLSEKAPTSGHKIRKISDIEHEVYHIQPTRLGTVRKTDEGWKLEDGTLFDQEQDAIRQLYDDHKIPYTNEPKERGPKVKIIEVRADQRHIKIAGFYIDTGMVMMKDFKFFRTTMTKDKVVLEACKNMKERDDGKWTFIGENTLTDAE